MQSRYRKSKSKRNDEKTNRVERNRWAWDGSEVMMMGMVKTGGDQKWVAKERSRPLKTTKCFGGGGGDETKTGRQLK